MPRLPDHWPVNESRRRAPSVQARDLARAQFPQLLVHRDRRPRVARERRPELLINPDDAAGLGVGDGDVVEIGNDRGRTRLHARLFAGASPGVLVSEGIWPPSAFLDGWGINALVGDDSVAPFGGRRLSRRRRSGRAAPEAAAAALSFAGSGAI